MFWCYDKKGQGKRQTGSALYPVKGKGAKGNMEQLFITEIKIEKVRHLKNITIPLAKDCRKHLILTGCNGSGKTSVLDELAKYLNSIATAQEKEKLSELCGGISVKINPSLKEMRYTFDEGHFVLGYYKAERVFQAAVPKHIEKVALKDKYAITENTQQEFVKYLADRQVTAALAKNRGDDEKADKINSWFLEFEKLLKKIYDDESLQLIFDEETYNFIVKQENREPFDFNTMSSGFLAVLDIISDLILKMEKITNGSFTFDVPGTVLIDEIETHLHLEMQKNILGILTTVFPNIQFIVSTHSPFILNSSKDVVIYDLEKRLLVRDGLANVPYSGIVEGYFHASELSHSLEEKFARFKALVGKKELSDDELEEIADIELYLDEIPDYLALDLTTEYQRLKLEYEKREDLAW